MLRIGRLHILGGCYRVIGQGLERRRALIKDVAKRDFIVRLCAGLDEFYRQCLAWALMTNHLNYKVMSVPFLLFSFQGAFAPGKAWAALSNV